MVDMSVAYSVEMKAVMMVEWKVERKAVYLAALMAVMMAGKMV